MKKFFFCVLLFYLFFSIESVAKENFYEEAKNKFDEKKWKIQNFYFREI